MEYCNACHKPFADYKALALHISHEKKGHRSGKIWAARYLTKVNQLNTKKNYDGRIPLTEEQKETRMSLVREVSGDTEFTLCVCPNPKCGRGHMERIEVEYLESPYAWKSPTGKPMILCQNCRRKE